MTPHRRGFLRGAGLSVALPFLPSLAPRSAAAAGPKKHLVVFQINQGGYRDDMAYPAVTERATIVPGHEIGFGRMTARREGSRAVVSRLIQADASALTDRMLGQVNVLRGFDQITGWAHNHSQWGNFHVVKDDPATWTPSIDQMLAWSPSFYAAGEFRERALMVGLSFQGAPSVFHSSPASRSGPLQKVTPTSDPAQLFDRLFKGFAAPMPGSAPTPKPAAPNEAPVVDLVLDHYKQLRDSSKRLSTEDRRRLDDHMQRLAELQRRVSAPPLVAGAGCRLPGRPGALVTPALDPKAEASYRTPAQSIALYQTYNDLVAAAFACGLTRVAGYFTSHIADTFSSYAGNWHQLSHNAGRDNAAGGTICDAHQKYFEHVMLDLARKLDAIPSSPGRTVLDDSLLVFVSEAAGNSHRQTDKLVLTIGSAGGAFKTGYHVDFRNQRPESIIETYIQKIPFYTGVPLNWWWANVLTGMGLPRSEWDRYCDGKGWGNHKFGHYDNRMFKTSQYAGGLLDRMGGPLPVIGV